MAGARAGADLLFQDEIRTVVRSAYQAIPTGAGRAVVERFYDAEDVDGLSEGTVSWALGVGNPIAHAEIGEGDVVLDVGCGGGIDTVLAARRVGSSGRVIAVDMLPEMRDRTRSATEHAGVHGRCDLRVGEMESLPLPDGSVDVVVSNGVLNLSPRKSRAIAEVARVLRPGGRLCVADLVVDRDLPPEVLASGAAWAGCIAGAISEQLLERKLARAGFTDIRLDHRTPFCLDDVAAYPLFSPDVVALMRRVLPPEAQEAVATSLIVRATRSADAPTAPTTPVDATPTGVTALDAVPADEAEAPGVTVRPLKQVDDVHLKVLDVAPRGSTPFHTHVHAHEGVIISGSGRLRLEGRDEPLGPGDVFTVNPNAAHAITADEGSEPLRFVCMDCFVE